MSDALCGPSNPLQNFQKNAQVDRTLQQDRLSSRRTPFQEFRSADPNAGILDPEFEAFQSGLPSPLAFTDQHQRAFHQSHFASHYGPTQNTAQAQPSWAADFQRMQIASPPPSAYHAQHVPQSSSSRLASAPQQSHLQNHNVYGTGSHHTFHPYAAQSFGGMSGGSMFARQQYQPMQQMDSVAQQSQLGSGQVVDDGFDEAAFAAAFDAAHNSMVSDNAAEDARGLETSDLVSQFRQGIDTYSNIMQEQNQKLGNGELSQLKRHGLAKLVREYKSVLDRAGIVDESEEKEATLRECVREMNEDLLPRLQRTVERKDYHSYSVYPELSLLRFKLFQCLKNPTEKAMHDAAYYLSVLARHDIQHFDNRDTQLMRLVVAEFARSDLPYSDRYDMRSRAAFLDQRFQKRHEHFEQAGLSQIFERDGPLYDWYKSELEASRAAASRMPTTNNVATDSDMRADLQMRLDQLSGQTSSRIIAAVPESEFATANPLSDTEKSMLQAEARNLSIYLPRAAEDNFEDIMRTIPEVQAMPAEVGPREDYLESNPAMWLWNLARAASEAPEVIESADALDHRYASAMSEEEMAAGLREEVPNPLFEEALPRTMDSSQILREDVLMEDQQPQQQQQQRDENDDLARTAAELLEKVSDNKTSKFQNSNFLNLMRRLRDKEMRVEGDKMVETGETATGSFAYDELPRPSINRPYMRQPVREHPLPPDGPIRDGQEVVDLLNGPTTMDQDPEFMMTSPFYDNEHAELGRRGLFED